MEWIGGDLVVVGGPERAVDAQGRGDPVLLGGLLAGG